MPTCRKPAQWKDPRNKPFPCPPKDFCGDPTDFVRMAPDTVAVLCRMLHISGCEHGRQNFALLGEVVAYTVNAGADVRAQADSNQTHVSGPAGDRASWTFGARRASMSREPARCTASTRNPRNDP